MVYNRIAKVSKNSKTEYVWDHRNRLVRVVDNGKSVEYAYDYQNRLVRRNDELFVHDGWQITLTLDAKGNVKNRYLWGATQDELLAVDDMWTLRDHLNTVRKVVDAKGAVVSELEYNAFGVLVNATGEKPLFRYTGKMFDDATELQWNVNRWYDASVGRWISEDPIGFEGKDANLYRYVINLPVSYTDPEGKIFKKCIILTIAAIVVVSIIVWFHQCCPDPVAGPPSDGAGDGDYDNNPECHPAEANPDTPGDNYRYGARRGGRMCARHWAPVAGVWCNYCNAKRDDCVSCCNAVAPMILYRSRCTSRCNGS